MPVHVHSGAADKARTARTSASTRPRCAGGRPGRCGSCSGRACSSVSPACGSSSPSAARSGRPTCCGRWTPCTTASTARGSSAQQLTPNLTHATERVLRPQLRHRRVEHPPPRAGPPLRDRRRQHHVGQRLPAPRGHVAAHEGVAAATPSTTSRSTRPRAMLGCNAAEVYGFDVDALRPLADQIGPTPDELGQTGDDLAKWDPLRAAGRPWLTGVEALPPASVRERPVVGFDPFEAGFDAWPYEQYRRLREAEPVHWCELLVGLGAHPLRRRVPRPPRPLGQQRPRQGEAVAGGRPAAGPVGRRHAAREGMTARAASTTPSTPACASSCRRRSAPGRSSGCGATVQRRVDAHLDRLGSAGEAELIERLRLPAAGRGVLRHARHPRRARPALPRVDRRGRPQPRPRDQRGGLRRLHGAARGDGAVPRPTRPTTKRAHPADDVLSALIAAEVDGERLTHGELVAQLITLYVAGHEPTTALIGNGLVALFRHPEQLAALQADPSLVPQAVLEMLRYDGPNQFVRRVATDRDGDRRRDDRRGRGPLPAASAPPTTIPSAGATTPTRCASTGPTPASTCSSAAASTTASAPTSPACRPRSRSPRCSPGSPACARPASRPGPAAPPSAASAPSRSRSEGDALAGSRQVSPSESPYFHFQSGSRFSRKAWRASALSSKPRRRAV